MNHPGSAQQSRTHPSQGVPQATADQIIDNDKTTRPFCHPCQQSYDIRGIEMVNKKCAIHHIKLLGSSRLKRIRNKHTNTAF
jgi:hypothetical protein